LSVLVVDLKAGEKVSREDGKEEEEGVDGVDGKVDGEKEKEGER